MPRYRRLQLAGGCSSSMVSWLAGYVEVLLLLLVVHRSALGMWCGGGGWEWH